MNKRISILLTFILMAAGFLVKSIEATPGAIDRTFAAYTLQESGTLINAMAQQADGKVIIGGIFSGVNGDKRTNIARMNADGTLDKTFSAVAGGELRQIAARPDGKVVIGGSFLGVNGVADLRQIARLNADGSLDTSFNPGAGMSGTLYGMAVQADEKVVVWGNFSSVQGTPRGGFARLNANGSLDTSFNVPVNTGSSQGSVSSVAFQEDGKLIIAGYFDNVNGAVCQSIARLNADGSVDSSFNSVAVSSIAWMALQPDGKIVIAGYFTTVNGAAHQKIARLNADGSLDTGFNASIGTPTDISAASVITPQPDGRLILGGYIFQVNGVPCSNLVRLNADGSLDSNFNPGTEINYQVFAAVVQPDGRVLVGGTQTNTNGGRRNRLTRFHAGGGVDSSFSLAVGNFGYVSGLAMQADGKLVIHGGFSIVNGQRREQLARLNADGTLDTGFNPGLSFTNFSNAGSIAAIVQDSNQRLLVAGEFTEVNGVTRRYIVRLLADGHLDPFFNTGLGPDARVMSVILQPDGKILISGGFNSVNGESRKRFARLNTDGSVDESFDVGANVYVNTAALQADGKIIFAGGVQQASGIVQAIGRLNSDGSIDQTFAQQMGFTGGTPGPLAIQQDGKILVGGTFNSLNGAPRNGLLRLNADGTPDTAFSSGTGGLRHVSRILVQPYGRILIGGSFADATGFMRQGIMLLNGNGSLNRNFNLGMEFDNTISGMAVQPDGKLVIVGQFRSLNGSTHLGVARLLLSSAADDFDSDGKTDIAVFRPSSGYWYISHSATNAFSSQQFGMTGDKVTPGDYDGDGKTDVAVFRPSNGYWYFTDSSTGAFRFTQFGQTGDIPTPADYDNDGKSDMAVFRPSTGTFYVSYSSDNSFHFRQWGQADDVPVVGDYDGDGKADFAIYRPSASVFYILRSSDGVVMGQQWGTIGDKPLAADFDGDGRTDISVYRPSASAWYYLQSSDNAFKGIAWGASGDVPAAGDYDGDGKSDVAVFRPSEGVFYILQSTNGSLRAEQFGMSGDVPVPSAYVQ